MRGSTILLWMLPCEGEAEKYARRLYCWPCWVLRALPPLLAVLVHLWLSGPAAGEGASMHCVLCESEN